MDIQDLRIVLASNSPRRKELLTQAGIGFSVIPSDAEEIVTQIKPSEIVMELSKQKAKNVFMKEKDKAYEYLEQFSLVEDIQPQESPLLVIGADTIVTLDGKILGKPEDENDAFETLRMLSNRTHKVYTGVTFYLKDGDTIKHHSFYVSTKVTLYEMTDEEISDYIATGDPMDKAGSYGIQGRFAIHVAGIEGDYNNVVGLPIARLYQELKEFADLDI